MTDKENRKDIRDNQAVAERLDPGWVRRDRLERTALAIAGALALGAIVVAIISIVQSGNTADTVHNFIQKTACTTAPAGRKCTHIKERIAKEGSIRNPCIEHQRVTGLKGANCDHFYISKAERETGEPAPAPASSAGPTSTTSTGTGPTAAAIAPTSTSAKAMPHGHPAAHHPQGGVRTPVPKSVPPSEPEPAGLPPPVTTTTTPSSGSETITTTVTPPPKEGTGEGTGTTTNPSPSVLGGAGAALGTTVESVAGTAAGTVEGTGEVAGGLVRGLTEGPPQE